MAETTSGLLDARTPKEVLRIGIRAFRGFPERCGDILNILVSAATVEPDAAAAVAEGWRRHSNGSRVVVDQIAELGGLRSGLTREQAAAFLAATTFLDTWTGLVHREHLSWDDAEALLIDNLGRALLRRPTGS